MGSLKKKQGHEFKRRREIKAIKAGRRESADAVHVRRTRKLMSDGYPREIASQMAYLGIGVKR